MDLGNSNMDDYIDGIDYLIHKILLGPTLDEISLRYFGKAINEKKLIAEFRISKNEDYVREKAEQISEMCKCLLIDGPRETGINSEYKVENYAIAYEIPFKCDLNRDTCGYHCSNYFQELKVKVLDDFGPLSVDSFGVYRPCKDKEYKEMLEKVKNPGEVILKAFQRMIFSLRIFFHSESEN